MITSTLLPTDRVSVAQTPPPEHGGGTLLNAVSRGIDSAQAGAWAFAQAISEATGMDVAAKFAKKGVQANIQEMLENPPEIRSWDDVDSLSDFGTYVLEALGEQAPQLAMQFAGAKAGSQIARAQLGKAMKRKLGEEAMTNYATQAALKGSAVARQIEKRALTGAMLGAGAAGVSQNIGESKMTLDDADIDDNAVQALMGGAVKGILDTMSFGHVAGLSKRFGVEPDVLPSFLARQAKRIGLSGAGTQLAGRVVKEGITSGVLEGATETAQSFIDQMLVHANKPDDDLFSAENLNELRESFIKGGLLGGTIGAASDVRDAFPEYKAARERAKQTIADAVVTANPSVPDAPVAPAPAPAPAPVSVAPQPAAPAPTVIPTPTDQGAVTLASEPPAPVRASAEDVRMVISGLPPAVRQQVAEKMQSGTEQEKAELLHQIGQMAQTQRREVEDTEQSRRMGRTMESTLSRPDTALPADRGVVTTTTESNLSAPAAAVQATRIERGTRDPSIQTSIDNSQETVTPEEYQAAADTLPDEVRARIKMGEPTIEDHYAVEEKARTMRGVTTVNQNGIPAASIFAPNEVKVIQDALPDELSPVPRTSRPSTIVPGANASTVERSIEGIYQARENGARMAKNIAAFSDQDETGQYTPRASARSKRTHTPDELSAHQKKFQEMRDTIFYAKDKAGNTVPLSTMAITTMGMDVLGAEGTSTELGRTAFRKKGFTQGLAILSSVGYDVSDAVDDAGAIKPNLIVYHGALRSPSGERMRMGKTRSRPSAPGKSEYELSEYDFDPYRQDEEVDLVQQTDQAAAAQTPTSQDDALQGPQGEFLSTREAEDAKAEDARARYNATRVEYAQRGDELVQQRRTPLVQPVVHNHVTAEVSTTAPGVNEVDIGFVAGLVRYFGTTGLKKIEITEKPPLSDQDKAINDIKFPHMNVMVQVTGDTMTLTVPPIQAGVMGRVTRQIRIGEAIGGRIFDQYLNFDPEVYGPPRRQDIARRAMERDFMRDTGKDSVDPAAFRVWFSQKTVAHVQALIKTRDGKTPEQKTFADRVFTGMAKKLTSIAQELNRIWTEKSGDINSPAKKGKYDTNRFVSAFLERVVREDTTSVWWDLANVAPVESAAPFSPAPVNIHELGNRAAASVRGEPVPTNSTPPPTDPPAAGEPPSSGPGAMRATFEASMDPAAWAGVRNLFSAGSQLRAAWEPLGLLVEQPTNTVAGEAGEAYHTAVRVHEAQFTALLNTILHENLAGQSDARIQSMERAAFRILTTGTTNADFKAIRSGKPPQRLAHFSPAELKFAADLHDMHDTLYRYAHQIDKDLPYVDGYFHRNYDMQAILSRMDEFQEILAAHNAEGVYDGMLEAYMTKSYTGEPLSPPAKHMKSRKIMDQALIDDLVKHGFLNSNPMNDMLKYSKNIVSRTEFDRIAPAIDAEYVRFQESIKKRVQEGKLTDAQGDAEIRRVQGLLNNALGLMPVDKSSAWYRPLEELRALAGLNSLLFGGLSGLVEAGMISVKTRGVVTAKEFARASARSLTNRSEAVRFAESMGIIHSSMQASMGSMLFANADSFDGPISKYIPKMLEWTGNETMARHMRILSASIGKEYLLNMADMITNGQDPGGNYARQLKELSPSLTPDMIRLWRDAGFPSWATVEKKPENHALYTASQQVNHAIARFVNETVVNPTAADTPPWARNPWGAFLFQLKGFTMTANKRMLMGAYRELRHQYEAGGISQSTASAAAWVLPGVAILLLLAAMQEELRQRLRSMGENGIVGNYHNDPVKIAQVLGDRAGITNLPFLGAVINPTTSNIAFELGPTVSKAVQLAGDAQKGDAAGAIMHITPGLSQLPGAREQVYKTLEGSGIRG